MRNGINRGLQWIKKVLEVTEIATVPTQVLPEVRPTIDVFGWDRLSEVVQEQANNTATQTVQGTVVPEGVVRLVVLASVNHRELLLATTRTLWIEIVHQAQGGLGQVRVGLVRPLLVPGDGDPGIDVPLQRWIVMNPGDRLVGKSAPATGVGIGLNLNQSFVEIPVGEYVPSL